MTKSGSNSALTLVYRHLLPDKYFNGYCLINNTSIPKKVINLYVSYTLTLWFKNVNTDFTLKSCLFGSVKLTKSADLDKYKYSGYNMEFDSRSEFLFTDRSMGKNVIIFGADMSSSVHINNENKNILILGEGPTRGLDHTTLRQKLYILLNLQKQIKDLY